MAQGTEFGLVKTSDGPDGECFWIVRLDVEKGSLARTMRSLNERDAREHLSVLGCPESEIDWLVIEARREFDG